MKQKQRRLLVRVLPAVVIALVLAGLMAVLSRQHFAVLDAQGTISRQQRDLLLFATILSLVVIIPVYILTFMIVRNYRVRSDGTQRAKRSAYAPDMDGNRRLETLWWGIPGVIILVLSVVTWQTSHSLDPYKPLASMTKPVTIQVVALQWKWLFIYPEQKIATVNYLKLPTGTPINFEITADAPMNSFWIPQLGGQIYAMPGMTSELHLQADKTGTYRGSSANLSGEGFSGMDFKAEALNPTSFNNWVAAHQNHGNRLSEAQYEELSKPAGNLPPLSFGTIDTTLFDDIVMKHMATKESTGDTPSANTSDAMQGMEGMQHAN